MTTISVPAEALERLASATMAALGSASAEADEVAAHLVLANLSGHDSHGVGMLPTYVRLVQDGLAVPNQDLVVLADMAGLLHLDAKRGLGQRMAREALDAGMARAKDSGACVVALRNSSHVGRVGHYVEHCAARGFASVHFVNVGDHFPMQAPYGCGDARLGTNPFAAGLSGTEAPVVLDMATSTIAFGKARVARNKGVPVPEGSMIDKEGRPTTDPRPMVDANEGAIRAFGEHKGSGLAILCELLGGALTGGLTGDEWAEGGNGIVNSLLSVVIDTKALGDPARIGADVTALGGWIKASPPAMGFDQVLLPGEPEALTRRARGQDGIPLDATSLDEILAAAETAGAGAAAIAAVRG